MNYPLFLARRLSLGGNGRKSSPAVRVATAAIALSLTVMLCAVAVVSGFKAEISDKVIGFNSHILLSAMTAGPDDDAVVRLTPALDSVLARCPDVAGYALSSSMPAILKTPDDFKGIYLRTLEDSATARFLRANLVAGHIPDFSADSARNLVVLSRMAALQLGLDVGDRIDTYFITDEVRVRPLRVAGLYDTHFESYDDVLAYGAASLVRRMADIGPDQGSMIRVTVHDFDNIGQATDAISDSLIQALARGEIDRTFNVDNARETGGGYFGWLDLLDMNVIVILSLMMAVGCITLVSGMLIMILDKKRFIGLLRALGATTRRVRDVFVYLALRVTLTGLIVGDALGLGLLWIQSRTHFIPLDADSYYIDFVPVRLSLWWILALNAGVLLVVWLVLILPSRFVARISPAETMRPAE